MMFMRTRSVLGTAALGAVLLTGCGGDQRSSAPPKPGTLAYDWYATNEAWKAADYGRAMDHLSRLAVSPSEYRDRARVWLIVCAAGIADGYAELANAYETGSKGKPAASDYRRKMYEARKAADGAAMRFAETLHDVIGKNKDPKLQVGFSFPAGEAGEPLQVTKIGKGLPMQPNEHEMARAKMAQRGVIRFAAALAGSPDDLEKAKAQFGNVPRDSILSASANKLVSLADMYGQKKLDLPQRGNALCKESLEAIELLPENADRKKLEAKAKDELKRYKVS